MNVENFFPLKEAKDCRLRLTDTQALALNRVSSKMQNKEYRTMANHCLCGSKENDIILAHYDRFGLPFSFKLCKECSLIRTDPVLDQQSLVSFYKHDFSLMHRGSSVVTDDYFKRFLTQGASFLELLKRLTIVDEINDVLEVGCSAGGNLYPLFLAGKNTVGYDYDVNYLAYGQGLGMCLIEGDYYQKVSANSQDLLILSHVLEHFTDPIGEINKAVEKIREGKYLLVEVPGIMHIAQSVHTPLNYFQNDHIFHFHKEYLLVFFKRIGLDVIYSDDICRLVFKKPKAWLPRPTGAINDRSLKDCYIKIQDYVLKTYLLDKYFPYRRIKRLSGDFLRRIGALKSPQISKNDGFKNGKNKKESLSRF